MPKKVHQTQYSQYVENMLRRAGREMPGQQANVHELARWMGLRVTPSFRKRLKQFVSEGMLWDVPPLSKENPKATEYLIPYGADGGAPW